MSAAQITFNDDADWRPNELAMTASSSTEAAVMTIDVSEEISRSARSTVYRGHTRDARTPVVLKFAYKAKALEDLQREADLCRNQLSRLQGTVIPIFYGLFEAVYNGKRLGCLVLEDCGDPPDIMFWFLPMVTRITILRQLQEIHRCGIKHEDFRERNVVLRDGKPRIIDFDRVSPHKGGCTMEIRKLPSVPYSEVDCNDIYFYCSDFEIWGNLVDIGRSPYPQEGLPPQEVIDVLIPGKRIYLDEEAKQRLLLDRLREINVELEKGVPLEAIEFDVVFVLGRPFRPASAYPPQSVVDDLLHGVRLSSVTPEQVESVAHVLREAKLAGSVSTEKVREKVDGCLQYLNRYRVLRDRPVFASSH